MIALLLALTVILWQLHAFVIPAFSLGERRVALPLVAMAPLLFLAGMAFSYSLCSPDPRELRVSSGGLATQDDGATWTRTRAMPIAQL